MPGKPRRSGEHRSPPAALHQLPRGAQLLGEFFEYALKLLDFTPLIFEEFSFVAIAAGGFIAPVFYLLPEILKGFVDGSMHRHIRHERAVAMRTMEDHACLKMAIRKFEAPVAIFADNRDFPTNRIEFIAWRPRMTVHGH